MGNGNVGVHFITKNQLFGLIELMYSWFMFFVFYLFICFIFERYPKVGHQSCKKNGIYFEIKSRKLG